MVDVLSYSRGVGETTTVNQPDGEGPGDICQRANQIYMGAVNGGTLSLLCVHKVHTMKTCIVENESMSVYKVCTKPRGNIPGCSPGSGWVR